MIVQVDPEARSKLLQKLAHMQESGELCDFTITVFGAEIKAHKCILAASSDYFNTSFSFSEWSQSFTKMDLTHLGCDVQVVKNVIRSFYTNQIDLDPNNLEGVLQLVDYFMMENLRLCIEMFMESTLSYLTAVTYFKLALQYRLDSTGLLKSAKRMMQYRFHDYFIYKNEALELSLDVIGALMASDIFHHCNPLQLVEYMLTNANKAFEREKLQDSGASAVIDVSQAVADRVESTFQKLSAMLRQIKPGVLEMWKPRLVKFLKTWSNHIRLESSCFSELVCHVRALEIEMSDKEFDIDCLCPKKNKCHVCWRNLLTAKSLKFTQQDGTSFNTTTPCSHPCCQSKNSPGDPNNRPVAETFIGDGENSPVEPNNRPVAETFIGDGENSPVEPNNRPVAETFIGDGADDKDSCTCTSEPLMDDLIALEKSDPEIRALLSSINSSSNCVNESLKIKETPQTHSVEIITTEGENLNSTPCESHTHGTSKELDNCPKDAAVKSVIYCNEPTSSASLNTDDGVQPAGSHPRKDFNLMDTDNNEPQCNVLVVLAPSVEMASQLMVIDDGEFRPLLRSPQLELCFYDIEAKTWYQRSELDFPIHGALLEKHSWRTAFLNNCLYMFSLGKEIGLELNITSQKWRKLDCKLIFTRHKKNVPVRSVIPIKVGTKLIVMSMSREIKLQGDYSTHQRFFEMDANSWTFINVATVQDDTVGVPITRWTVSDDILITVKASTMMYNNLSRVQFVHFYNAMTKHLETQEFDCTMEAGVKLLAKDEIIYLLDREGWCRSYNMKSSSWTGMHRYPFKGSSTLNYLHGDEPLYPALTHVTCHAGSSRWEITTSRKSINAFMQEMVVDADGQLITVSHPPPPFQFMTAMCQSTMSRSKLESMERSQFVVVDNQMLDFSFRNPMEKSQYA